MMSSARQVRGIAASLSLLLGGCASLLQPPQFDDPFNTRQDIAASFSPDVVASPPMAVTSQLRALPIPQAQARFQIQQPAEPTFDLAVVHVPVQAFFASLVADSSHNIVVAPELSGSISLTLKGVTLEQTLAAVRDSYAIDWERKPYGYRVFPAQLQTRVFKVNYLNIERQGTSQTRISSGQVSEQLERHEETDGLRRLRRQSKASSSSGSSIATQSKTNFWAELETTLQLIVGEQAGHSVQVSPQAGVVVVRAMPEQMQAVQQYLQTSQASLHRQVILEAKVVEVELSDNFQSGINWAALGKPVDGGSITLAQTGGGSVLDSGRSAIRGNSGDLNPNNPNPLAGALHSAFGGVFSAAINLKDFQGFIELLKGQGEVQVLSSPRVATLNNQKAIIKVGSDEFFVTDIATSTTTTGSATTTTPDVTLTPFFSGIALDVTPQISADGMITLHIHPTVSEVRDGTKEITIGSTTQRVPLAVSSIRESDSIVRALSGQVVVIGGLMQSSNRDEQAGVPVLKDAPLIGGLFRHERQQAVKKELVILLKPVVVSDGDWQQRVQTSGARVGKIIERGCVGCDR